MKTKLLSILLALVMLLGVLPGMGATAKAESAETCPICGGSDLMNRGEYWQCMTCYYTFSKRPGSPVCPECEESENLVDQGDGEWMCENCFTTFTYQPDHTHSWRYNKVSDSSIKAFCNLCPEGYGFQYGFTVTISAPANLVCDGSPKEASISGYPASAPSGLAAKPTNITYVPGGSSAPTEPGTYTASFSWGVEDEDEGTKETASVSFTLVAPAVKTNPTASDFTFTAPANCVFDGFAKTATVVTITGITGMGNVTVKYYSDAACTTEVQDPINAGTYYVGITVTEGDSYNATTSVLHDSSWQFTIANADPSGYLKTTNADIAESLLWNVYFHIDGFDTLVNPKITVGCAADAKIDGQSYTLTYDAERDAYMITVPIRHRLIGQSVSFTLSDDNGSYKLGLGADGEQNDAVAYSFDLYLNEVEKIDGFANIVSALRTYSEKLLAKWPVEG